MAERKPPPKIRIGDAWIPAHRLWNLVESVNTATDLVEKYNEKRAHLATPITEEAVERVRERIKEMELSMGGEGALAALAELSAEAEREATRAQQGGNDISPAAAGQGKMPTEALAEAARQLLEAMPLEDALRMLEEDYGEPISAQGLIALVGEQAYLDALTREGKELHANMIGPDQIALLWNDAGIARPHGGFWTERDVAELVG